MTGYEMVLLARCVEECGVYTFLLEKEGHYWKATKGRASLDVYTVGFSPRFGTRAEALADLLRELGVEVPDPPSAERVARLGEWYRVNHDDPIGRLQDDFASEPQTVLALLEGGGS